MKLITTLFTISLSFADASSITARQDKCDMWTVSAETAITDLWSIYVAQSALDELRCAPIDDLVTEVVHVRLPEILGRDLTVDELAKLEEILIW